MPGVVVAFGPLVPLLDQLRDLRHAVLCADEPQDEEARQHYQLAHNALFQAESFLSLAIIKATRER